MRNFWATADGIPLPDAYVLAINLSELFVLIISRKPSAPLAPSGQGTRRPHGAPRATQATRQGDPQLLK
jgi:hypothetical protein